MEINISDLISALTTTLPEKGVDWNATNSRATNNVDDSVKFNEDAGVNSNEETDSANSIPHSAVPRLLSW